jgi:porin
LKVGRQDAAADFGLVDFGAEFLNSSFGVIPTSPLPTFPDPALGVSAFADLTGELSIGVGVYASTPTSWGRIRGRTFGGEVGFAPRSGDARSSTKYRVGFWYQRHPADPGAPGVSSVYAALDQVLFREGKGAEGLSGFLQLGTSTGAPNGVSDYLGAGLVYTGLLPGRNEDRVGLGVAHARLPAGTDGGPTETAIELLYRVRPWRWLTLQPSVHWLLQPGGRGRNAIVAGLRIETGF